MGSKTIRNIQKIFRATSGVIFGRTTAGTGRGEELTPSAVRTLLSVSTTAETGTLLAAKADLVSGVIPSAQIPAIAITEYLGSVASQVAMLALVGDRGDWCLRSDTGTTWVLSDDDSTLLASWIELNYPTAPVTSVNGKTGAVTLSAADVGAAATSHSHAQSDITNLVSDLSGKQATLVSGTNLKTVNGSTLLGSGDLIVSGGSSLAINPGYRTNYYYSAFPCIAPGVLSLANNRIHYIPFQVTESVTFTRIGINVTTLQAASVVRLGIYNSSGGKPSTLLVDAGTVAGTSTGEKEITISQAMTPGWYWLAWLSDVNSIGVTAENGASSGDTVRVNLGTSTGAGNGVVYIYETFSYAALPANAGTLVDMTGASNPPRIWLRKV